MSGSEPGPRFALDDVPSCPVLIGIAVVAAGWLAIRWPFPEGLSIPDFLAAAMVLGTAIQIGVGGRRIEIDAEEIRVYRRGRLRRSRRVDDLRTISSVLGIQSLVCVRGDQEGAVGQLGLHETGQALCHPAVLALGGDPLEAVRPERQVHGRARGVLRLDHPLAVSEDFHTGSGCGLEGHGDLPNA